MIKAVIFDMDGTLLDTEKYYIMFWPKALEHFGYKVTREQVLTLRSLGRPYAPEYLKKMVNDPNLDYEAVRSYRRKIMKEYLKTVKVDIKPGAVEILTYLKDKNIHRAVATASDQDHTVRQIQFHTFCHQFSKRSVQLLFKPVNIKRCQHDRSAHPMTAGRTSLTSPAVCFYHIIWPIQLSV